MPASPDNVETRPYCAASRTKDNGQTALMKNSEVIATIVETVTPVMVQPKVRLPKTRSAANRAFAAFGTIGFEQYRNMILERAFVPGNLVNLQA